MENVLFVINFASNNGSNKLDKTPVLRQLCINQKQKNTYNVKNKWNSC